MNSSSHFVELRSEETQEILSRPPSWMMNWGITVILSVLIGLLCGAWLVHYPEVIHVPLQLMAVNAPKAVLVHNDSKIIRLFVRDGKWVQKNSVLAYLESTADHEQILKLIRDINKISRDYKKGQLDIINLEHYQQLGELQNSFQVFYDDYINFSYTLKKGFYLEKQRLTSDELTSLVVVSHIIENQQLIQEQDAKLADEEFAIQKELFAQRVISPLELKREESKLLFRKLPYQQTSSALINNKVAQQMKQIELLELNKLITNERQKFLQSLNTLYSASLAWKFHYIIVAPLDGYVYNSTLVQENQAVVTGQELFYISPLNGGYYGELRISQQKYGSIKVGQPVLIKFIAYPFERFGMVKGQITFISEIPLKDGTIIAKAILPNGLKTTLNEKLPYRSGMLANSEIIIDDKRLLEKLFYQLRGLIDNDLMMQKVTSPH